jgi:hypothetical protein
MSDNIAMISSFDIRVLYSEFLLPTPKLAPKKDGFQIV